MPADLSAAIRSTVTRPRLKNGHKSAEDPLGVGEWRQSSRSAPLAGPCPKLLVRYKMTAVPLRYLFMPL